MGQGLRVGPRGTGSFRRSLPRSRQDPESRARAGAAPGALGTIATRDPRPGGIVANGGKMELSRHETSDGAHPSRWAIDGNLLPADLTLSQLLALPRERLATFLRLLPTAGPAKGKRLPPIDRQQEVWAAGVTYLRSRDAREAETTVRDVYSKVYDAERPELFMKSIGWRVVGHDSVLELRR